MIERALRRLVGAVTRRPLVVLGRHRGAGAGWRRARAAARAERGHGDARGPGSQSFKDTERFKQRLRRRGDPRAGARRAHAHRAHRGPQPRPAARGLPRRQRPGQQEGARQPSAGLPGDRRAEAGEGRVRPGHVHQHRGRPDPGRVRAQAAAGRRARRSRPPRPRAGSRSGAATRARSRSDWLGAAADAVQAQFINETLRHALKYGHQRHPADQRPLVRLRARVRPDRGGVRRAEVALRIPVPVEELGADPDPPAAGPHARPSRLARST